MFDGDIFEGGSYILSYPVYLDSEVNNPAVSSVTDTITVPESLRRQNRQWINVLNRLHNLTLMVFVNPTIYKTL